MPKVKSNYDSQYSKTEEINSDVSGRMCEWQGWRFFFRKQKTKKNWPYLFVQSGNKITEQDTEHMHSDSSDPRAYFVILIR